MSNLLAVSVLVDFDHIDFPGTLMIHLSDAARAASGEPGVTFVTPLHIGMKDLDKIKGRVQCADAPLGDNAIMVNATVLEPAAAHKMKETYFKIDKPDDTPPAMVPDSDSST